MLLRPRKPKGGGTSEQDLGARQKGRAPFASFGVE